MILYHTILYYIVLYYIVLYLLMQDQRQQTDSGGKTFMFIKVMSQPNTQSKQGYCDSSNINYNRHETSVVPGIFSSLSPASMESARSFSKKARKRFTTLSSLSVPRPNAGVFIHRIFLISYESFGNANVWGLLPGLLCFTAQYLTLSVHECGHSSCPDLTAAEARTACAKSHSKMNSSKSVSPASKVVSEFVLLLLAA